MIFSFDDVTTFFLVLLAVLAVIVLIGNATTAIGKIKGKHDEPLEKVEHRVDDLEGRMVRVEEKLDNDWEFRQEEIDFNKLILQSMKQIVKHLTKASDDENERKQLESVETDIDRFLIEH